MNDEQTDLENLVKSPGWLRFQQAQDAHWQAALSKEIATAANDRDDLLALQKIRQIIAAQRAVQMALAWPQERIRALVEHERLVHAAPTMTRGGFQ